MNYYDGGYRSNSGTSMILNLQGIDDPSQTNTVMLSNIFIEYLECLSCESPAILISGATVTLNNVTILTSFSYSRDNGYFMYSPLI